jgi:hypothetical protein
VLGQGTSPTFNAATALTATTIIVAEFRQHNQPKNRVELWGKITTLVAANIFVKIRGCATMTASPLFGRFSILFQLLVDSRSGPMASYMPLKSHIMTHHGPRPRQLTTSFICLFLFMLITTNQDQEDISLFISV